MADGESQTLFMTITGCDAPKAVQYLQFADGTVEAALELYYANNGADLATGGAAASSSRQVIDVDDDPDVEQDSAFAQRMQNDLYQDGGDASDMGLGADRVRAPMARTTETLVGPGADTGESDEDRRTQMLARLARGPNRRPQRSPFSQGTQASPVWGTESPPPNATQSRLEQLYSPPTGLFSHASWDQVREQGKREEKWVIVDVQNPQVFDCQRLNRDIWKDKQIQETLRANFITLQYDKNHDVRAMQYIQYYFPGKDLDRNYPHIAIVDPRTGEQVKTWSGPPVPTASQFLGDLHVFLDRYSLSKGAKNPVAKRKVEGKKDVGRMTEEEQMQWAIAQSANGGITIDDEDDPDALTKSVSNLKRPQTNGKGKEAIDLDSETESEPEDTTAPPPSSQSTASPFSSIPSNQPHHEPATGPAVTRIQFRYSGGRIIRRFELSDLVRRIYEWLRAEPIEGKSGVDFELKCGGKDLIEQLEESLEDAGLKNQTVMIEFLEE